jgi:cytochrome P450
MGAREPSVVDDFFKPATWENPYPVYSAWRDRSPLVARMPFVLADGSELEAYSWLLLKHDEVYGALRDHETFSSDFPPVLQQHRIIVSPKPGPLLAKIGNPSQYPSKVAQRPRQ